jgi:hypothetical protein
MTAAPATEATTDVAAVPDLHELVESFGTYGAISGEGWADFDEAMSTYQRGRREGLRPK